MKALKITFKILISVTVITGVIFAIGQFITGDQFRVRNIEIEMEHNASQPFIFSKIKDSLGTALANLAGQYVWKVDIERVLKTVQSDQRVKDVKVTRILPNTIQVVISPYTPVANIIGKQMHKIYPLARNGEILPAADEGEVPDGPILRGEEFLHNDQLRKKAIEMLFALPELGSMSLRNISDIRFDSKKGFELILNPDGARVWLGQDDFVRRARQSQRVLDYLDSKKMSGRIIDARFSKKVVVRLRNEP